VVNFQFPFPDSSSPSILLFFYGEIDGSGLRIGSHAASICGVTPLRALPSRWISVLFGADLLVSGSCGPGIFAVIPLVLLISCGLVCFPYGDFASRDIPLLKLLRESGVNSIFFIVIF
jgi:hypothetical protein